MSDQSFVCSTCGQTHPGLPTDYGFRLPDEVHALTYVDRYLRSRSNADLCTLDECRYFFRGLIPVPFSDSDAEFGWGVWVEVSKQHHDVYVSGFGENLSNAPPFPGRLANDIPGYGGTVGLIVAAQFQSANSRPVFSFPETSSHALALEQRHGITRKRHHDLLEALGFFKEKDGV